MTLDELRALLLWCLVVNCTALLPWFGTFALARDWLYRLHSRWFRLPPALLDALHCGGLGLYKRAVLPCKASPLLALPLMR